MSQDEQKSEAEEKQTAASKPLIPEETVDPDPYGAEALRQELHEIRSKQRCPTSEEVRIAAEASRKQKREMGIYCGEPRPIEYWIGLMEQDEAIRRQQKKSE